MNEHTRTAGVPDLLQARDGALDLVGNAETIRSLLSSCCSSGRPAEVNLVQTVVDVIRAHQNIRQKAITEVSDELTAVREGPFRCGEICTANAHEAAIAFKRSVMSRLWSAADFLQYAKCHGDSSLRMDSSVIADRFEDICQAFQDQPFPPAKEITAEIKWEAAKACQARGNKQTPPTTPSSPNKYLMNWQEILDGLNLKFTAENRRRVRATSEKFNGPIVFAGRGSQPKVNRDKLLAWWNKLEERFQESEQENADAVANADATLEAQHEHGRDGKVLPDISGHVQKRRGKKNRR